MKKNGKNWASRATVCGNICCKMVKVGTHDKRYMVKVAELPPKPYPHPMAAYRLLLASHSGIYGPYQQHAERRTDGLTRPPIYSKSTRAKDLL